MNSKRDIYSIPYSQYLSRMECYTLEETRELAIHMAQAIIPILDLDFMKNSQKNRFTEIKDIIELSNIIIKINNAKTKVEIMAIVAFLANRATKFNSIAQEEKPSPIDTTILYVLLGEVYSDDNVVQPDSIQKVLDTLKELLQLSEKDTMMMKEGLISGDKDRVAESCKKVQDAITLELLKQKRMYDELRGKFYSADNMERKKALRNITELSDSEFADFYKFVRTENRKDILYDIKHKLVAAIIKELEANSTEPEYRDYIFGFIKDDESHVFALTIPGYVGTYQFHIQPSEEKSILSDVESLGLKHPFEELVVGDTNKGNMSYILTKDDLRDVEKLENTLKNIKKSASRFGKRIGKSESNLLRSIFMISVLLGKDPKKELEEANKEAADQFLVENDSVISQYYKEMPIEDSLNQREIVANLKKFHRIYVSSPYTIDSRMSIEALRRKCKEWDYELKDDDIIEIPPGSDIQDAGIYINHDKNGSNFNRSNYIFISPNEKKRETSVCAILYSLGFDVPRDVALCAGIPGSIIIDPQSAYLLVSSSNLTGEQIYELCEELKRNGETIDSVRLTEEQIERYGLQEKRNELEARIQSFEPLVKFTNIGKHTVGINSSQDPMAFFYAYEKGAEYVISVNDYISEKGQKGIQFAIQSNPAKCDLPAEIVHWALRTRLNELRQSRSCVKKLDDMLVKSTRIIMRRKYQTKYFSRR